MPAHPPKQQLHPLPAPDGMLALDLEAFEDETRCAVCLGVIKEARLVAQCMHRFCSTCIEKWLRLSKENVCPQCRKPMQSRRDCKADLRFDRIVSLLYDDVQQYEAKVFDASEEVMLKAFQQGAALKRMQEERKAATRGRGNWRGRGRSAKPRGGRAAKPVPAARDSSSAPSDSDSDDGFDSGGTYSNGASKAGAGRKQAAGSKRTAESPAAGARAFKRPTKQYSPGMYRDDAYLDEEAPAVGRGRGRGRRSRGGRGSRGARHARSNDREASPVEAIRGSRGRGQSHSRGRVGAKRAVAAATPVVEYVFIRSDTEVQQQAQELAAEAAAAASREPEPVVALHVRCEMDDSGRSQLPRPYFSCPASLTVGQLQRVIEEQLIASGARGREVQVVCCCNMDGGNSKHILDRHCALGMQDVLESDVTMSELVHDLADCRQPLLMLMFRTAPS